MKPPNPKVERGPGARQVVETETVKQPDRGARLDNERGKVEVRIHGAAEVETLVYLPGIHGDWTLAGGFRRALGGKVRFVEIGYPVGAHWTERDYAEAILQVLAERGIHCGWLLGESFGSQIVWEICDLGAFQIHGIILAGGFVRHPLPFMAKFLYATTGERTFRLVRAGLTAYARVARLRFGRSPEMLAEIQQFIARRTEADLGSARHRLALVARYDPRNTASSLDLPVFALNGLLDPVVPYLPVTRWLKRNCRGFQQHKLIWRADHNVLGTAPKAAANQVLNWMSTQPAPGR